VFQKYPIHVKVSLVSMAEGVLVALLVISALVKMETLASIVVSLGAFRMYSSLWAICSNTFVLIYYSSLWVCVCVCVCCYTHIQVTTHTHSHLHCFCDCHLFDNEHVKRKTLQYNGLLDVNEHNYICFLTIDFKTAIFSVYWSF